MLDVLKKDLKHFNQVFLDAFLKQLQADGLLNKALEKHLREEYKEIQLSTTDGDKSTIGFMNDCIFRLKWDSNHGLSLLEQAKRYLSKYYNEYPLAAKKYNNAKTEMRLKYENEAKRKK